MHRATFYHFGAFSKPNVLYMLDRKQIISAPFLLHIYLFRGDGLKQLHWLGQLDYDFIDWELHVKILMCTILQYTMLLQWIIKSLKNNN